MQISPFLPLPLLLVRRSVYAVNEAALAIPDLQIASMRSTATPSFALTLPCLILDRPGLAAVDGG